MDHYEVVKHVAESGSITSRTYYRDPYVRVQETIAAVASSIQANPRVSTRNLSAQLGRSIQRIIYDGFNRFPYKVQIISRLNALDLPIGLEL